MLDPAIAVQLDRAEACWVSALTSMDASDLDRRSGCEEWANRQLVNHLVGGGLRYAMLLDQNPPAEVEATRTVDHLGEDPLAAFWDHERRFRQLAAEVDLTRLVSHRIGALPGTRLVRMRILELTLHARDLSVGTGQSWPIHEELAAFISTELEELILALGASGGYAAPAPAPDAGETVADRVLRISGRTRV